MRLLILTQAMDAQDPVMGFFVRWVEEFSKKFEQVHVICLKGGEYEVPMHVSVHSLGKESVRGTRISKRIRYTVRFVGLAWLLRHEYDVVLVHMNQEYVLIAGLLWRVLGKRVGLWRNHKEGTWMTRLAGRVADVVFYTSPQSYVASFPNAHQMPVGIDVRMFSQVSRKAPKNSVLFLGRIDPVKKLDVLLEAITQLFSRGIDVRLSVYGEPTDPESTYYRTIRNRYSALEEKGVVTYHGNVRNDRTPAVYATHRVFVNLTQGGSFDKTIFEAMASGCLVVMNNVGLREVLPRELFLEGERPEDVGQKLIAILAMSESTKGVLENTMQEIPRKHSLDALVDKLWAHLQKTI